MNPEPPALADDPTAPDTERIFPATGATIVVPSSFASSCSRVSSALLTDCWARRRLSVPLEVLRVEPPAEVPPEPPAPPPDPPPVPPGRPVADGDGAAAACAASSACC